MEDSYYDDDYAKQQEIVSKKWEEATIQNNFVFSKTMEMNPKLCKELIECILERKIESIAYPEREKVIENRIDSKGVRLDVYVKDETETVFDLEMQVSSTDDDLAKRMRYYQAAIDMDNLKRGEHYNSLKKSYIIFICPFDPFNFKRRVYTFHERCAEEPSLLLSNDGTTKIFLNTKGKVGDVNEKLNSFLDYVERGIVNGSFVTEMNEAVRVVKTSEKARLKFMGYEMDLLRQKLKEREEGRKEGREEGRKEGREEGREEGRKEGEKCGREAMRIEMSEKIFELERKMAQIISEKDAQIAKLTQRLA